MDKYEVDFTKVKNDFAKISDMFTPDMICYKSPIDIMYGQIASDIHNDIENNILTLVHSVDISVDKTELVKALNYDRNQYQIGYKDANNKFQQKVMDVLSQISLEEYTSENLQYKKAMSKALDIIKAVWLEEDN